MTKAYINLPAHRAYLARLNAPIDPSEVKGTRIRTTNNCYIVEDKLRHRVSVIAHHNQIKRMGWQAFMDNETATALKLGYPDVARRYRELAIGIGLTPYA